jgi:hypothetical protein
MLTPSLLSYHTLKNVYMQIWLKVIARDHKSKKATVHDYGQEMAIRGGKFPHCHVSRYNDWLLRAAAEKPYSRKQVK